MNQHHVTRGELHTKVMQISGLSSNEVVDRPDETVSRIEAAVLLSSTLPPMNTGIAGGLPAPFKDMASLTAGQQNAVAHVYHLGIMTGNDAGLFEPHRKLLRDEADWILRRAQERIQARKRPVPYEIITEPDVLPQLVLDRASEALIEPGVTLVNSEEATYVVISGGERNTGGYSIAPTSVVQGNGQIEILVELQRPDPNAMILQAITYPQLILRLPQVDQPVVLLNPGELAS
ncbi:S-layer family protein [Tumebacillus sp. BK434]|uniref:protease complex subunit PrcB family protein n=1 Tax=Tumebacillus sp. BK434 TaxID=2512169 RepID=UPI0010463190|nr:protease complex subunit PrcB family protein [Tumebacillus sp. BK434]TCP55661.1 S-layer family protein [Tumebacillus sp. BK434]